MEQGVISNSLYEINIPLIPKLGKEHTHTKTAGQQIQNSNATKH